MKCAKGQLIMDCPKLVKIAPKYTNYSGHHTATYRGCPKIPIFKRKITQPSKLKKINPKKIPLCGSKTLKTRTMSKNPALFLTQVRKCWLKTLLPTFSQCYN